MVDDLEHLELTPGPDPRTCTVSVFAKPRARKSQVVGIRNGRLELAIAAPPAEGAANAALLELVADVLGLPKRDVSLLRGASSKTKQVRVVGRTADEVRTCLREHLAKATSDPRSVDRSAR